MGRRWQLLLLSAAVVSSCTHLGSVDPTAACGEVEAPLGSTAAEAPRRDAAQAAITRYWEARGQLDRATVLDLTHGPARLEALTRTTLLDAHFDPRDERAPVAKGTSLAVDLGPMTRLDERRWLVEGTVEVEYLGPARGDDRFLTSDYLLVERDGSLLVADFCDGRMQTRLSNAYRAGVVADGRRPRQAADIEINARHFSDEDGIAAVGFALMLDHDGEGIRIPGCTTECTREELAAMFRFADRNGVEADPIAASVRLPPRSAGAFAYAEFRAEDALDGGTLTFRFETAVGRTTSRSFKIPAWNA